MSTDDAVLAWRQTDNDATPKLDLSSAFTAGELVGLRLLLTADLPPALVGILTNLVRQMADPRLTNGEQATMLLNLVRRVNMPRAEANSVDTEDLPEY